MGQLTIRKVDDDLIRRLKDRAASNNRSAEAEVRMILEEVLGTARADARAWAARAAELAHRHARPDARDSAELVRETREARTEQLLDATRHRR